jgi:hypothetical protein
MTSPNVKAGLRPTPVVLPDVHFLFQNLSFPDVTFTLHSTLGKEAIIPHPDSMDWFAVAYKRFGLPAV